MRSKNEIYSYTNQNLFDWKRSSQYRWKEYFRIYNISPFELTATERFIIPEDLKKYPTKD